MSLRRIFFTIYLTGLLLVPLDMLDGKPFAIDVDDVMRALQIRQLLSPEGHFWDLTLPFIKMPEPYVSPWSRFVDFPYLAIAWLLTPSMGPEPAMHAAFLVWPPLLLGLFSLALSHVMRCFRFGSSGLDTLLLVASGTLIIRAIWEFTPGRIDHHNMQLTMLMTMLAGICVGGRFGGIAVGLGALFSIVIGLEGLPFVVTAFGCLVVAWLLDRPGMATLLLSASAAMVVATLPAAFVFLGPAGMASTQCDAFSAPYIVLLVGASGSILLSVGLAGRMAMGGRALVIAAAGCATILAVAFLYPECLKGPYWMIDPVSKHYWFDPIVQEQNILYFLERWQLSDVMMPALASLVLLFSAPLVLREVRLGNMELAIVFMMGVVATGLTIAINRNGIFAMAFSAPLLPVAYAWVKSVSSQLYVGVVRRAAIFVSLAAFAVVGVAMLMVKADLPSLSAAELMAVDDCTRGDLSGIASVAPGTVIAPLGLALSVAKTMPKGFAVAALPFHRSSPGIRRVFEAFLVSDADARRRALEPFDYLAVCRLPFAVPDSSGSPYAVLASGGNWPGLIPVQADAGNAFTLFRIDHTQLR